MRQGDYCSLPLRKTILHKTKKSFWWYMAHHMVQELLGSVELFFADWTGFGLWLNRVVDKCSSGNRASSCVAPNCHVVPQAGHTCVGVATPRANVVNQDLHVDVTDSM